MMLKPVLSPHQTCLVFELFEAFGTGISHPCWAEDCVSVSVPAQGVKQEVFQEKIPVRD